MRGLTIIIFLCIGFWARTLNGYTQGVEILSNFDRGSIGILKETEPNVFRGQTNHFIKNDKVGDQYYWFYFKLINGNKKEITITLDHLKGIYRGQPHLIYTSYTQPVISDDNKTWKRVERVSYDSINHTFEFKFIPWSDTVWLAYAQPYSYGRFIQWVRDGISANPLVKISEIGQTYYKRPVNLITVTRGQPGKKNIFLISMQHAGEDEGGYLTEGLVNFLLSDNSIAKSVLNKCNFYIIPMMNPDGYYYGTSRYNWRMEDLNAEWFKPIDDNTAHPVANEISSVKRWISSFIKENNIDLFFDIHNHGQQGNKNGFYYYKQSGLTEFAQLNRTLWDVEANEIELGESFLQGSSTSFMFSVYDVPSILIELTQSFTQKSNGYLTIDDYYKYGEAIVKAIDESY